MADYDTLNPPMKESERRAMVAEAVAAERERCANLVPTNWCDSLLTGKDGISLPLHAPGVERLLLGIKNRILKSEVK